jgi:quinol monooxygenase YgiN
MRAPARLNRRSSTVTDGGTGLFSQKEGVPMSTTVTFVNRFTVQGDPQDFERAFDQVGAFMGVQPGIIGYTLSRDISNPRRYVNIALWESADALQSAVEKPEFKAHVVELRQLAESESALYVDRVRGGAGK